MIAKGKFEFILCFLPSLLTRGYKYWIINTTIPTPTEINNPKNIEGKIGYSRKINIEETTIQEIPPNNRDKNIIVARYTSNKVLILEW